MNESFIHFNERKRMCFNKKKQKNFEMRLIYKLFKMEIVYVYITKRFDVVNIMV